jgi:methylated-DNA-[protein]-cysteine S-methyltransferase
MLKKSGPKTHSPSNHSSISFASSLGEWTLSWQDGKVTQLGLSSHSNNTGPQQDPVVNSWLQKIQDHLAGQMTALDDIPIEERGLTPFCQKVYRTLREKVGPGQVISYGELAKLCDTPRAHRAVGMAMAKNPFPLLVPCHRVILANGKLGGFSIQGGSMMKQKLLQIEKVNYFSQAVTSFTKYTLCSSL